MNNKQAYAVHEGQIGVRVTFLISGNALTGNSCIIEMDDRSIRVCTYEALKKRAARTPGLRLREGKGAGNEALFSFENMPLDWQAKCLEAFGDPKQVIKETVFLERFYERDASASAFYNTYRLPSGSNLKPELKEEYTVNASVLNAVVMAMSNRKALRKAYGNIKNADVRPLWDLVLDEVEAVRERLGHTLKLPSLRHTLARYKKDGYRSLVSGKLENQNTAKVVTDEQRTVLEKLLKKHSNYDNHQVARVYNEAAAVLGWKGISPGTVAKYRKELDLYIVAGNQGAGTLRNTRNMQVKRKAPNVPMVYWTIDGWDVELLYQSTGLNNEGKKVTTYHNRPTTVVILDPYLNYPVGYAIGTHETTGLIREALRNAANHTKELFGQRYKSLQVQSDHYGKGVLTPIYEAMTKHYTPARVRNAKAKRVEPFFKEWNKELQLYAPNWSGFGIPSRKESQPNSEYLDKIKHSFPDFAGVVKQIEKSIELRRMRLHDQYVARWHEMADADHIPLTDEEYLYLFGDTTGYTNKLEHSGLTVTIDGTGYVYDSFDVAFREQRHLDWCVKFDREDLSKVLVVNAKSEKGRMVEELGTVRFMLEEKYVQPMALYDRGEGDAAELARVDHYNKSLEERIIDRDVRQNRILNQMFVENPALNGTLTKLVLTDSLGQHKDQKSNERLLHEAHKLQAKQERQEHKAKAIELKSYTDERDAYIDSKVNIEEFLNQ